MSFSDKDYYQILGISPDASGKEIKECYKKLMMENHPDRFKGLKAKYQTEGDEVLLEVLEEKIRQADEACKFINEAYKVLSDPELRKAYDGEIHEPKVPVPEIVVSPTELSFGTLNEGQRKSKSFTIENKGGPAVTVEINWEDDPDWGELIIEPDPEETFPIKVTVATDTRGIPSGPKSQKIQVVVDGIGCTVKVSLAVISVKAKAPVGTIGVKKGGKTISPLSTGAMRGRNSAIAGSILALLLVYAILFGSIAFLEDYKISNLCSITEVSVKGNSVLVRDTTSWGNYIHVTLLINGETYRQNYVGTKGREIVINGIVKEVALLSVESRDMQYDLESRHCGVVVYP